MKRVLLTGATGFIGANLARRLVKEGYGVHLLVRPNYLQWRIKDITADVQLHQTNLGDEEHLTKTVGKIRPDIVFHLAAYGAYPVQNNLQQMIRTNIIGTANLVNACLKTGFEVFVNTGSSSEYGFKSHAPSETEWLEPNSHYAVTKASATMFCCYTAKSRRVHIPTLRLYSVYGPYEELTRLIPTLIQKGLNNEWPPLVDPYIARDYVYIEDVVDAYLLAATKPNKEPGAVYNVGTGVQTTLWQVVDTVRRVMNITSEPEWGAMPNRHWDTAVWVADNQKIRIELGWQPHYTFEQGFCSMLDRFKSALSGK